MKKTRNLLIILLLSALVILGLTNQVNAVEDMLVEFLGGEDYVEKTGNTYKLLKDITIDEEKAKSVGYKIPLLNEEMKVVIDLNGHDLSSEVSVCIDLPEGAELTVNDSSEKKDAEVENIYFNATSENELAETTLTINAGSYIFADFRGTPLFVLNGYVNLVINDGIFDCIFGINSYGANVTINNGKFSTSLVGIQMKALETRDGNIYGNLTIENGEFIEKVERNLGGYSLIIIESANATINGGYFEGTSAMTVGIDLFIYEPSIDFLVTINGGKFVGRDMVAVKYNRNYTENLQKLVINGGTFIGNYCAIGAEYFKGLTLKGGEYKSIALDTNNYGAISVITQTEEEARSILPKGYRYYNNNELTERDYFDDEKYWCTDKEVKVAPEKLNVKIEPATNGKVGVDKTYVAPGEEVKIVVEANEGYEVDKITVKTASGEVVEVSNNTFTMPIDDVVVSASFKEKVKEEEKEEEKEKEQEEKKEEEKDDTPKTGCAMPNMLVALFAVLFK